MRTHCQTIDTRWEAIIIPTIRMGTPSLIPESPFGMNYLPSPDDTNRGLVSQPQSSLFSGFRLLLRRHLQRQGAR